MKRDKNWDPRSFDAIEAAIDTSQGEVHWLLAKDRKVQTDACLDEVCMQGVGAATIAPENESDSAAFARVEYQTPPVIEAIFSPAFAQRINHGSDTNTLER